MKTSVSVICYKHKMLANGEYPIMLRVAKDGKRTMKSLGVSVNPIYWDFNKSEPKSNCPNQDLINKIILQNKLEYQSKILEKRANDEEFTATSLRMRGNAIVNKLIMNVIWFAKESIC